MAAVDDHFVTDLKVGHGRADLVDDAGRVAAADVKVLRLALLLTHLDDVHRHAERGPDIVVVDPGGHDVEQHLMGCNGRDRHDLLLEAVLGLSEAVLAHQPGMHVLGHDAERRRFSDGVAVSYGGIRHGHVRPPFCGTCASVKAPLARRAVN